MTNSLIRRAFMAAVLFLTLPLCAKAAPGWPANYEGVMLQGFYWDSYTDTKWTNLESQADELSKYFSLIWIPNSARAASLGMGYDPVYWFTNHNTKFGTEAEVRKMIKTFKAKNVGIIEDVVINHRSGASNWTDFPAETWNGKTWKIGPDGICSTDEVKDAAGQAKPTGAPDTGEDFNGSRDLDHTNATVQENCKAYTKFLLEDMGYAGFRYDMVKGYAGRFTKIYNEYSKPTFSVGEYWDGSYDAVAGWIEATGKTSAAFDFPFKYQVNKAFATGNMSELVWKANGTTDQPAGLIHFGYPQYAVTFIDNHDTYRDGSKFTGNVPAANAFMLSCPGTPCVFLPHWKAYKAEISAMIDARNLAGIHNLSAVRVLKSSSDCYMAEVTGKRGKLAVKIGPSMDSPAGYTSSDIKATGKDYCIWVKTNGQGGGDTPVTGDPFMIYYDNTLTSWTTPHIHYWGASESSWPGVAMNKVEGNIWGYQVPAGTTGCLFNAGDGDASKTDDMEAQAGHVYTKNGDNGVYQGGQQGGDDDFIYIIGEPAGGWSANVGERVAGANSVFVYEGTLTSANDYVYFGFAKRLGSTEKDWDTLNAARYGSSLNSELPAPDTQGNTVADYYTIAVGGPFPIGFPNATSWRILPGTYKLIVNTSAMTLTVENGTSGIEEVETENAPAVYFNLQGVRVDQPSEGLYIRVRGQKADKIYIR